MLRGEPGWRQSLVSLLMGDAGDGVPELGGVFFWSWGWRTRRSGLEKASHGDVETAVGEQGLGDWGGHIIAVGGPDRYIQPLQTTVAAIPRARAVLEAGGMDANYEPHRRGRDKNSGWFEICPEDHK
ncbi:hypothetical protein MAPG_08522 [Magnaporthiopsis poae ATCC 64411]|uniref:Uncharacterized protein n=1 Tax=Magnaporthiopsis poae (strain ATCC 64411 / 73-15) TaxID=644358 RepID=A0A0C4E7K9_MAGP6|nr:hypothetical protein MAPG_08522 [Magnaporthiopsis poae ATCC 64411]